LNDTAFARGGTRVAKRHADPKRPETKPVEANGLWTGAPPHAQQSPRGDTRIPAICIRRRAHARQEREPLVALYRKSFANTANTQTPRHRTDARQARGRERGTRRKGSQWARWTVVANVLLLNLETRRCTKGNEKAQRKSHLMSNEKITEEQIKLKRKHEATSI